MKRLSRYALAVLILLPVAGLMSACGEAPKKDRDVAERNTREDDAPATAPAPQEREAQVPSDEPAGGAAKEDDPQDAVGRGRSSTASRDEGSDGTRAYKPKKSAPAAEPPPPPAPAATPEPAPGDGTLAQPAPSATGDTPPAENEPTPGAPIDAGRGLAVGDGDKAFDVVPVYYGTDRAVEADPKRLKFGAERGHKLQLGRALITVPTAHKVPSIERPWVIEIPYFKVKVYEETEDPAKHFTLQELKALNKEELLALVKERLAKSSAFKDHAIVFVHGFNTSFDYALYRTAQIAYDLKFDGAPFVYSWPSGGKVASYTYDRGSAEQAEPHLAEFLDMVVKESGAKSISLIAHSMGNEVLLRVLERMRARTPEGVVISQVILAAPDVDRDKFDNIAREITGFAKGVTLYAASNDRALRYSASFWGGIPRAGDVPETGPLIIPGVDTIDVSAVSTDSLGLNHSGYAENNALLNDIKLLIQTGERPPDKRIPILQAMKTATGGAYWRYPPAN